MKNLIRKVFSWFKKERKLPIEVQINGFRWDVIEVSEKATSEDVEKLALNRIQNGLWKTKVVKVVSVPGKLINFITQLPAREPAKKVTLKCQKCKKEFQDYPSKHPVEFADGDIRGRIVCFPCENGSNGGLARAVPVTDKLHEDIRFISSNRIEAKV